MKERIQTALQKLFERHRVVFWYDAKRTLRSDYEALELPGIEKIELANNEFGVKYRILREEPEQRFLLFREGPQPPESENWLLDVQLAHAEFRTDQVALWLAELELPLELASLLEQYEEFFKSAKRREALGRVLEPHDGDRAIRMKMIGVCAGTDARLDAVLEALLQELAAKGTDRFALVQRCGLERFFWEQMERIFGYCTEETSLDDFVIELFKSCYAMGVRDEGARLCADALVFLKRWKDSRVYGCDFEVFAGRCADVLGLEQDLGTRDFRDLLEIDFFELIDRKILSELVKAVAARTLSHADVMQMVRRRRQSHWYHRCRDLYEAVDSAAMFFHLMGEVTLALHTMDEGVERYTKTWFRVDQVYRQFVHHTRRSGQASLMGDLAEQVENLYTNKFLLRLGDLWTDAVEHKGHWRVSALPMQSSFFADCVEPFLKRDKKVCVIISDAMRFEVGDELATRIRQEDRYSVELGAAMAVLPSYTQLGMAALLPHRELALMPNDSGTVLVDGMSSQGLQNREKILLQAHNSRAKALRAEDFMATKGDDCRQIFSDHDVLYIYHNRIDAMGDKRESEEKVFEAVEETLDELIKLIKKLTGANASNILVTADHGFLYQNRPLLESDFCAVEPVGAEVWIRDRRFVVGKGLKRQPGFITFAADDVGLVGELELQVPKSINRLRQKGSGSRFVHGGASLQEVVVPVLKINKKRQSDVSQVEVEILRGASTRITSGQLAVVLYQMQPVSDKLHARTLRAGLYTAGNEAISDSHEIPFDSASDNPRDRECAVRFVLSRKADEVNGQEVLLKLEERVPGTSQYREYKSLRYTLQLSFTRDFDF